MGSLKITLTSGDRGKSTFFGFWKNRLCFSMQFSGREGNETRIKIVTFAPMCFSQKENFINEYGRIEFWKRSGQGRILVGINAPSELVIIRENLLSDARGEGLISLSPRMKSKDLYIEKKVIAEFFLTFGQCLNDKLGEIYFDFL